MVARAGHCGGCTKSPFRRAVSGTPDILRDPTAVRSTGILTCVGICPPTVEASPVLRFSCLLLLHHLSTSSTPSNLFFSLPSPSFLTLLASSSFPVTLFAPLLTLPPRRYTTASSTPFFLPLSPLRVTTTTNTTTTSTSPPPPPSASWPGLPHLPSRPARFPTTKPLLSTNDQPLSLQRVPLFLRERNLSFSSFPGFSPIGNSVSHRVTPTPIIYQLRIRWHLIFDDLSASDREKLCRDSLTDRWWSRDQRGWTTQANFRTRSICWCSLYTVWFIAVYERFEEFVPDGATLSITLIMCPL